MKVLNNDHILILLFPAKLFNHNYIKSAWSCYSQQWIRHRFSARREEKKERRRWELKINHQIIILTVNSDKNRI